ncbi:DUF3293 domain-containing protein [Paraburkholderia sp. A1RI-2L]|uniref:DUF3293 domain-containing protein n=1 Tax=Paraburkholderia sp. A1RI-2L TaxID=3028367 RepID=UPI003B78E9DB
MFSDSGIPRETIEAYLETHYCIHGDTPTILKVGETNRTLAALHKANHVACSAFITACNPFSQIGDGASNASRQEVFARELRHRSLIFIDGVGQHPSNQWSGEASYLVLGLSLEAAKTLGTKFEQNAIVWSGADVTPQLILLR